MKDINILLLLSRWLHISAVIVAIGGAAFLRFALHRAATDVLEPTQLERLREAIRRRWSRVLFACIGVLLLTGSINFVILAMPPKIDPIPYHPIFGVKFFSALAVFFIASALAGRSPAFAKMRAEPRRWLSVILILAAGIVLLSGLLSQIRTNPGNPSPSVESPRSVD